MRVKRPVSRSKTATPLLRTPETLAALNAPDSEEHLETLRSCGTHAPRDITLETHARRRARAARTHVVEDMLVSPNNRLVSPNKFIIFDLFPTFTWGSDYKFTNYNF